MELRARLTRKVLEKVSLLILFFQSKCLLVTQCFTLTHRFHSLILICLVIESWAVAEPSPLPIASKSFPATNREALKKGCLTSKAQREYGKQHPVMKQNPKRSNMGNEAKANAEVKTSSDVITSIYQRNLNQQPHQVFGIQTKKNDASMNELLRCIPSELEEETDYPDLSGKKRKGRIPPAKATKASRSIAECRPSDRDVAKIKAVEAFKMKKFLNVQSKVKCYM